MKQYKRESRKQKQKQSVCVCVRISKVLGRKYLDDEDRLLVLQGEVGESVDWRDRLQGHLAAGGPGQVGTEHHGQVAAGHLVQTASILYLPQKLEQVFQQLVVLNRKSFQDQYLHIARLLCVRPRLKFEDFLVQVVGQHGLLEITQEGLE